MVAQLYSIYDRVAMDFGPIFQARNDGVAVRAFRSHLEGKAVSQEEYCLMHVGEFDSERGAVSGVEKPRTVEVPEGAARG